MMRLANKQAKQALFERHRHGAVVVKGGRVLSTGFNEIRYTKELRRPTLHAEEAAILKLLKQRRMNDLIGSEIYVSRVKPNGSCGLSKPCANCLNLIRSVGIKRVYYTTDHERDESMSL